MMREQKKKWKKLWIGMISFGLAFTMAIPANLYGKESGEGVMPASVDITKPVIEKVDFPANGTKVAPGDKLPIYVDAYDADSGIEYMTVFFTFARNQNSYTTLSVELKNTVDNHFEGFVDLPKDGFTSGAITGIEAVDKNGNYTYAPTYDDMGENIYSFQIDGESITDLDKIEHFEFKQNQKTMNSEEELELTLTVTEEASKRLPYNINVEFYNEESSAYNYFELKKVENTNVYSAKTKMSSLKKAGKWKLDSIYGFDNEGTIYFSYEDKENVWFIIEGKNDDTKPVITSITMDHIGEKVSVGDHISFTVKAKDDVALNYDNAWLGLSSTEFIQNSNKTVLLSYDEENDVFVGTYEVTKDTYPSEWYINDVSIHDTSGNQTNFYEYTSQFEDHYLYYFLVEIDGTFVGNVREMSGNFYARDEYGYYSYIGSWENDHVGRRATLKDANITFPNGETEFGGLKFIGWADENGKLYTDDTLMPRDQDSVDFYAVYDKAVVDLNYQYVTEDFSNGYSYGQYIVDKDMTYRELITEYQPKDIYSEIAYEWKTDYSDSMNLDDKIGNNPYANFSIKAIYKDHKVVETSIWYVNETGNNGYEHKSYLVNEGTTYDEIKQKLVNDANPTLYQGLRLDKWNFTIENAEEETEVVKDYTRVTADAIYKNCVIRFYIYERMENPGYVTKGTSAGKYDLYVVIAEKGDEVTVPDFSKYKDFEWTYGPESNPFIATNSVDYYAFAGKKDTSEPDVPKPDEPEKPGESEKPVIPEEKPGNTEKPSGDNNKPNSGTNTSNQGKELSKEVVKEVVESIASGKDQTINIVMEDATIVPEEILKAAKGKDVDIKLNMGAYTWTINGKDIKASNLKDINLEVKMDTNAVPNNLVKQLANDQPVKQLSLTHNGDFGFKGQLSLNLGAEYQGKYGNLYYYDSTGKLVFMNAGKINPNGEVSLSFSHASDYVIVINDKKMDSSSESVIKGTAKEGNQGIHFGIIILGMITVLGLGLVMNKKRV